MGECCYNYEKLSYEELSMIEVNCGEESLYRSANKSLARPTFRCILFDGKNISFDASHVIYIYIYIVLVFLQL